MNTYEITFTRPRMERHILRESRKGTERTTGYRLLHLQGLHCRGLL